MPSVKTDEPEMPERRGEVHPCRVPLDERDAEDDEAEPDHEEEHHGGRADEGEDAVTRLVVRELRGDAAGRSAEGPGQHAHGRRRGDPGHDERGEHAPGGGEDEGDARARARPGGRPTPRRHPARCPGADARGCGQRAASLAAAGPLATSAAGTSTGRERSSSPEALRLRVQTEVRRHAPAEDAVDDEVHRPQVRQRVAADRVGLDLGQQRLEERSGELVLQPGGHRVVVGPDPDVGVPALVPRAGTDEHPQRDHDGVARRRGRAARAAGASSARRCGAGGGRRRAPSGVAGTIARRTRCAASRRRRATVVGQ